MTNEDAFRFTKYCNVYIHRNGARTLVASTFNHGGLTAEKPGGVGECSSQSDDDLGQLIKRKFSECEYVKEFNYRDQKRSDWPAYRASNQKTIKGFENDFVRYSVAGANEVNLVMVICSPELANGVRLESTISAFANPDEIGATVKVLHAFFLKAEKLATD